MYTFMSTNHSIDTDTFMCTSVECFSLFSEILFFISLLKREKGHELIKGYGEIGAFWANKENPYVCWSFSLIHWGSRGILGK